ncbi:MAG TPA: zinc-dependent peptidase [Candidatus Hydrogenedentes bacterium]|nr:zinc-dependent peptidase [Candidatus Hydrogenedentota bacterium]HRT19447.1 zinc-dependent peptidase [Candidatus Hydrogenedentota bacterium]HRT63819.1 zinc-dependent peptidase [Candidatus Hydrogenedentota bacterium]
MFDLFGKKRRRRETLRKQPFPAAWRAILEESVPHFKYLEPDDQDELQGHIQVFLDEKVFEGCGGLVITDEIRLTVAAYACLMILHRDTDYYPKLVTILVYPSAFVAEKTQQGPGRLIIHGEETRVGESWDRGVVILAWDDVLESLETPTEGHNVIVHEFAHQLDQENGTGDGYPDLDDEELMAAWPEVFQVEYDRLLEDLEENRETFFEPYAAESPAEFFAIAVEYFFVVPQDLEEAHPELYEALMQYFQQDPASYWNPWEEEAC